MEAVASAASSSINDVNARALHFHLHRARCFRFAHFRHKHFGEHDSGGRSHDDSGEQVRDRNAGDGDIRSHDRAGDVGHAADHDGEEFRFRQAFEEGANGDGRFGLAHDDAGRHAGGFCPAGAHKALHKNGHAFHKHLHHAQETQIAKGASVQLQQPCGIALQGAGSAQAHFRLLIISGICL